MEKGKIKTVSLRNIPYPTNNFFPEATINSSCFSIDQLVYKIGYLYVGLFLAQMIKYFNLYDLASILPIFSPHFHGKRFDACRPLL